MENRNFHKRLLASFVIAPMFLATEVVGDELELQRNALDLIGMQAERICNNISLDGEHRSLTLSGEGRAEVGRLVQLLSDIGFEGALELSMEQFQGLLQSDLGELLRAHPELVNVSECKLKVFYHLSDRILTPVIQREARLGSDGSDEIRCRNNQYFLACIESVSIRRRIASVEIALTNLTSQDIDVCMFREYLSVTSEEGERQRLTQLYSPNYLSATLRPFDRAAPGV